MEVTDGPSTSTKMVSPTCQTGTASGDCKEDPGLSTSSLKHQSQQGNASIETRENSHQASGTGSTHHISTACGDGPPLTRQVLSGRMQSLIDQINEKRKRDTTFMEAFRKAQHQKVDMTCDALEERMYRIYDITGKDMQPKIQELFSILDRVASMEEELHHFKHALGTFCKQIQGSNP